MKMPLPTTGTDPPRLMRVKASMLAAIATWGSMPKIGLRAYVSDVWPVTYKSDAMH